MEVPRLAIGYALAALALAGCVSGPQPAPDTHFLRESPVPAASMRLRSDLVEISDSRMVLDLSMLPSEVGMAMTTYNPFDTDVRYRARIALCPVREPFAKVLEAGTSKMFFGSESISETVIRPVPSEIGLSKESGGVRCSLSGTVMIDGEELCRFSISETSPWTDESAVPGAVYLAAASLGNKIVDCIAGSRRLKDAIAAKRSSGDKPPEAVQWKFSAIEDGGFSGSVVIDAGSWDMARVQLWAKNQIERTALAKLGAKSMENYRVVYDGASQTTAGTMPIKFHVYPYRGFEIPEFDSRTRRGTCRVDISYLGISESDGYERAVAFVERILADQGIVKTAGKESAPARYKLHGYKSSNNGTTIEIPFSLVE